MTASIPYLANTVHYILSSNISQESVRRLLESSIRNERNLPFSKKILEKISKFDKSATTNELHRLIATDRFLTLYLIGLANKQATKCPKNMAVLADVNAVYPQEDIIGLCKKFSGQDFPNFFSDKALALSAFQNSRLTNLLAQALVKLIRCEQPIADNKLSALTANFSTLISLPLTTLALYDPIIYAAINLDGINSYEHFIMCFKSIFGLSIGSVAKQLGNYIGLPTYYDNLTEKFTLLERDMFPLQKETFSLEESIALASFLAQKIAFEICSFSGIQGIQALIRKIDEYGIFNPLNIEDSIAPLPNLYIQNFEALDLTALRLPNYLNWFALIDDPSPNAWYRKLPQPSERIRLFINELRVIFANDVNESGTFAYAIYCTFMALIKGLNFDRATLLVPANNGKNLKVAKAVGVKLFQPEQIYRPLDIENSADKPDAQAFFNQKTILTGTPLFQDGWPFVAFPIVQQGETIGVFYADKIRQPNGDALLPQEEIACVAIAEEWQSTPKDIK